jgi:cAMP-dependent protein kinase regulator
VSPRFVPASVAELSRIGLLAELPGRTLSALAGQMRREEVAPGTGVITEGDEGDRFYVVLSGMFAVSNQGALGPRRMLRPGDYFGEVALAMDIPRTANVTALSRATVASCDRATFDEFVRPLFADDPSP